MQFKKYDIPFYKKKSLGQRFLKNKFTAEKIVCALDIEQTDTIIEIGPGKGVLTNFLVKTGAKIIAVELDNRLMDFLNAKFSAHENFTVINENILNIDFKKYMIEGKKVKLIGNIPYHLTSSIIFKTIEEKDFIESWVMTVQKEVAERIVAAPGGRTRGILSVITQFYGKPELLFTIPAEDFSPVPKVDSAVIAFKFFKNPEKQLKNEQKFIEVVKTTFEKRRKMLRNSLKGINGVKLDKIGEEVQLDLRPEKLSVEDFIKISNIIS